MNDKITVGMPVWIKNVQTMVLTQRAIESFGANINLIIIDNDSDAAYRELLIPQADIYVHNKTNLGYAKAVNQILKFNKTELVAIANNDIRVSPNWQEVAREVLREQNTYSCHFRMTDYDVPFAYGNQIAYTGRERWCTSSFFVLNTKEGFQLYDENYGLGGYEDYDYWYQVRKKGHKTAYTTKACYQHHHSFTQNQLDQTERAREDIRRKEYFKSKFGEYPEELFKSIYPKQWEQDYWRVLGEL